MWMGTILAALKLSRANSDGNYKECRVFLEKTVKNKMRSPVMCSLLQRVEEMWHGPVWTGLVPGAEFLVSVDGFFKDCISCP